MKKPAKPQSPAAKKHAHVVALQHQLNKARHQTPHQLRVAHGKQIQSLKHQLHVARATPPSTAASRKNARIAARKTARKRAWSPDSDVALCSARAVAESLRLALGVRVADEDVLRLHWAAGGDPDTGASILATLEATRGQLGVACEAQPRDFLTGHGLDGHDLAVQAADFDVPVWHAERADQAPFPARVKFQFGRGHGLILGLDLPYGEPHAVAVGPDGTWWSWGEPHAPADFPGAVVEEAWVLTWRP